MALARRVAAQLKIPFYAVDAQQLFRDQVVQYFIEGYTGGITPNPCLACNRLVRWGFLLDRAVDLGARHMATGHYARLIPDENGKIKLLKGIDPQKDQSYVLHFLGQSDLEQTLFPLGGFSKPQVREMAKKMMLPVAEKPDSQDLCFLGVDDYRKFLLRHAPDVEKPGPIYAADGELIGEHRGLAFYTIGQRKGLGISSPEPFYVIAKDEQRNALLVGKADRPGSENPERQRRQLDRWRTTRCCHSARRSKSVIKRRQPGRRLLQLDRIAFRSSSNSRFEISHPARQWSFMSKRNAWAVGLSRNRNEGKMSLPSLLLGFVLSTLLGAGFHVVRGGGGGKLLLDLVAGLAGFLAGTIWLPHAWVFTIGSLGSLHLALAIPVGLVFLFVGNWLSPVEVQKKSKAH